MLYYSLFGVNAVILVGHFLLLREFKNLKEEEYYISYSGSEGFEIVEQEHIQSQEES